MQLLSTFDLTPARVRAAGRLLLAGGAGSGIASLMHLGIVIGGPAWYRFFGAGEELARRAARGALYPAVLTISIATVLAVWALYAFSGAGVIRRLPFLRPVLAAIAVVYLGRGILGIPAVLLLRGVYMDELKTRMPFMLVTSIVCVLLGLCYAAGAITMRNRPAPRFTAP